MRIHRNNRRTRNTIAATLVAGAALAGAFGAAAPTNAVADLYLGLSYSFDSDISGIAVVAIENDARINSLGNCQDKGGNHCVWFGTFRNTCAAMAIEGVQEWNTATGASRKDAENQALAQNPGSHVVVSGCTAGSPRKPLDRLPREPFTVPLEPFTNQ
jgi:hypothetical protein